jgi:hypothetical protein
MVSGSSLSTSQAYSSRTVSPWWVRSVGTRLAAGGPPVAGRASVVTPTNITGGPTAAGTFPRLALMDDPLLGGVGGRSAAVGGTADIRQVGRWWTPLWTLAELRPLWTTPVPRDPRGAA